VALAALTLSACGDDAAGGADHGSGGTAAGTGGTGGASAGFGGTGGAAGSSSCQPESEASDFVESFVPEVADGVSLRQLVHLTFRSIGDPTDSIDPATVQLLIDGVPARIWPYRSSANREFRFVPFPLWEPARQYELAVPAGVAWTAHPDQSMAQQAWWRFCTADVPFTQDYQPGVTGGLEAEEITLAHGGLPNRFTSAELITDWQNPASVLRRLSEPVDPADAELVALATKMEDSLFLLGALGLAAPQLGIDRRLFVAHIGGQRQSFVNPRVVSTSSDELYVGDAEACLSIDGVAAFVARPKWIDVAYDLPGGGHVDSLQLSDFDAKVWLHEYDHLNGILIVDRQQDL